MFYSGESDENSKKAESLASSLSKRSNLLLEGKSAFCLLEGKSAFCLLEGKNISFQKFTGLTHQRPAKASWFRDTAEPPASWIGQISEEEFLVPPWFEPWWPAGADKGHERTPAFFVFSLWSCASHDCLFFYCFFGTPLNLQVFLKDRQKQELSCGSKPWYHPTQDSLST